MATDSDAKTMLAYETRAMLARLALVKPFALQESMLPAAALLPTAQVAIDRFLVAGRRELRRLLHRYLQWLHQPAGQAATPAEAQRRFTILRLKFNIVLIQFDMFADVITQRSENETGVWLSGLDVVAADALALPAYYESPPVICYLDRDVGAAIRRARTRMPGGGQNPVAIVRIPRERMVGTGIASSLVHEVGHQAAASARSRRVAAADIARPAAWRQDGNARLAAVGAMDLGNRRRFLVGGPRRHRRNARPDRRREPAASFRLPSQRRRSTPDPLDPRHAQRRHGRSTLSASAMAAPVRDVGVLLSPVRTGRGDANPARGSCRRACRRSSRCSSIIVPRRCAVAR